MFGGVTRDAILSDDGRHRYRLRRLWGAAPPLCWVMLNPSVADALIDDPTVEKCMRFADREGFGGIVVVNLFAFRATDPAALRRLSLADAIGSNNDEHLRKEIRGAAAVVAAWGALRQEHIARRREVLHLIADGRLLKCLGLTKGGHPRHPLYLAADTPMVDYKTRVA